MYKTCAKDLYRKTLSSVCNSGLKFTERVNTTLKVKYSMSTLPKCFRISHHLICIFAFLFIATTLSFRISAKVH